MIVVAAIFALSLLARPNCVFTKPDSSELSCLKAYRMPINETTSDFLSDGSIQTIQGDVFDSDNWVQYDETIEGCVCHLKACIRKCCPEGAMFVDSRCNGRVNILMSLGPALSNFHVTYGTDCGSSDRVAYVYDARIYGNFNISKEGVLTLPNAENYEFFDYCLEYTEKYEAVALVCVANPKVSTESWLYLAGRIISALFLLVTFIVYALLPEKNIYNRLLMCYAMSLMSINVLVLMIGLIPLTPTNSGCTFIGTLSYFLYLVSYCCVNVIAYDICSTFRNILAPAMSKSKKGKKRMLFYSLYVLGIPLFMVVVVITLTKTSELTAWYNPRMGIGNCWFSYYPSDYIYFYFPMTITVLIDTILFAGTAWYIKKIKNGNKQLEGKDSQKYEKGKQLFIVYLILCLFIGINTALIIIGLVVYIRNGEKVPTVMGYLTNLPFTFHGIFVFFLFVFKRSIWKQLKKRFNNERDVTIVRKTCACHEGNSSKSNVSSNTSVTKT